MKKRKVMITISDEETGEILIQGDHIIVTQVVQKSDGSIYVVVYNGANAIFHLNMDAYLNFTIEI